MSYARHDEVTVDVEASAGALFDHLDDQERLAGHMEEPSMMMMGGRMWYEFDAAKGRAVGLAHPNGRELPLAQAWRRGGRGHA